MDNSFLNLSKISSYQIANICSDKLWKLVISWNYFEKKTLGEQLIRSIDSISANIAEGFGRYFKKDKVKFYYYARGSVYESLYWLEKCSKRGLISQKEYSELMSKLNELPKDINSLIKYTNLKLKT